MTIPASLFKLFVQNRHVPCQTTNYGKFAVVGRRGRMVVDEDSSEEGQDVVHYKVGIKKQDSHHKDSIEEIALERVF